MFPIGHKETPCHMILNIKHDLMRKARLLLEGHRTDDPAGPTYPSVVTRDGIRPAYLLAALNDLDAWAANIQNAYRTAVQGVPSA